MSQNELAYFALLKQHIASTLQQSVPGVSSAIESWKGQDIVYFQEDLAQKINGRISEKWFYTHIKDENQKLPRIDILNLLSRYTGYIDWADFKLKNEIALPQEVQVKRSLKPGWIVWSFIVLLAVLSIYLLFGPKTYRFYFLDADKKTTISNQPIDIILLYDGESPEHLQCKDGCFSIRTAKAKIRFVVKAPYYKADTITRILNKKYENIPLQTNDYALMIHYFSTARKVDWMKRRKQLDLMITENARIFQVYEREDVGMELYNKQEFIDKLTMPVQSLKDIEVIETIYTGNKISMLKFKQLDKPGSGK